MSNITVDTAAGLNSALKAAQDGDVILLKPGVYDGMSANYLSFANGITVTSYDPANPATLTHFDMISDNGITFQNVQLATQQVGYFDFQVFNSNNIHFDHVSIHGSLDGNPLNDIEGLGFSGCTNISVTNSEFQQLLRGLAISMSNNVTVSGNTMHDLEITGMAVGGGTNNITISNNAIWNLFPQAGEHPDAIQFLTSGSTVTSTGITVQLTDGSSRVVLVPASASITKSVNGASADLVAGKYVTVTGTANSDGSVTASEIQLRNAPPSPRPSASPTAP